VSVEISTYYARGEINGIFEDEKGVPAGHFFLEELGI
jgi:hypothetical protein